MMPCKRVAVVGCGISGIYAIKSLKEESIEPVCYEKCPNVGGLWFYRENDSDYESATVMSTTTLQHSKEIGAISNFPFPEEAPNYMRHDEVYKFLINICDTFDFWKHIICNREVIAVKKASDYEESGRWDVTISNTISQETITETFDAVIMCTGLNGPPNMPLYPGMDKFQGRIMHSQKLRTFESFAGQNVVVVGTGSSAIDAAVEISHAAKRVYWSVRTPSWILSRIGPYGLPFDFAIFRRYFTIMQDILPTSWASKILQHLFITPRFNHKLYGINPTYPALCRDPVVNDFIPKKLMSGSVVLRKNIREIKEDGVIFEGETKFTKADAIIMATGYKFHIPCLEEGILLQEEKGKTLLYKCVFPPHLKHPTISFVHYFLPFSPGFPLCELQCRWIVHILSGKGSLPSQEKMMKEIDKRYKDNVKRYSPSDKMSLRIDYVPYMDNIASEIGAKPNFWKMAFTDPRLCIACIFGPSVSYQYRLEGPHKWDGARKAILTVSERVKAPLKQPESDVSFWDLRDVHAIYMVQLMALILLLMFIPFDNPTVSSFIPLLFALHQLLVRIIGGRTILYFFLPICIASWFWFPNVIQFVLIFEALCVLMCN